MERTLSLSVWHHHSSAASLPGHPLHRRWCSTCPDRYFTSVRRRCYAAAPLYGTSAGPAALVSARPLIGFRLRLSRGGWHRLRRVPLSWFSIGRAAVGCVACDAASRRGATCRIETCVPVCRFRWQYLAHASGRAFSRLVLPLCQYTAYRRAPGNESTTCLSFIGGGGRETVVLNMNIIQKDA